MKQKPVWTNGLQGGKIGLGTHRAVVRMKNANEKEIINHKEIERYAAVK